MKVAISTAKSFATGKEFLRARSTIPIDAFAGLFVRSKDT
jgi:hypothetical protein